MMYGKADVSFFPELPSFTHPPLLNPPTPKEGEMLTMTCIASGLPDPKYVFLKVRLAVVGQSTKTVCAVAIVRACVNGCVRGW